MWNSSFPDRVFLPRLLLDSPLVQLSLLYSRKLVPKKILLNITSGTRQVLIDEITPAMPLNEAPHIERGHCEDWPACGHEQGSCPPRWSHTGRAVGMICAICGGEMSPGPSSIHPACMRRSIAQEDPYFYPDEEYDEEGEPFEDDRAFYEEGDDYRRNPSSGEYA
ncbi:MAG: hypothetical protein IIB08_01745, partial [Bacteroidetes bacterium]|nr:hypothetical protein [Bacteroidota bacterium]